MQVDFGGKLVVPQEIVCTKQRPDIVLWSLSQQIVYFIELTVPFEDSVEEAYERKKLRYADLGAEAEQRGWKTRICPVEVGCVGSSTWSSHVQSLGLPGLPAHGFHL